MLVTVQVFDFAGDRRRNVTAKGLGTRATPLGSWAHSERKETYAEGERTPFTIRV
jgi:hypothetical protein